LYGVPDPRLLIVPKVSEDPVVEEADPILVGSDSKLEANSDSILVEDPKFPVAPEVESDPNSEVSELKLFP